MHRRRHFSVGSFSSILSGILAGLSLSFPSPAYAAATERQQFLTISPNPITIAPDAELPRRALQVVVENVGTDTWFRDLGGASHQVLLSYRWYRLDGTLAQPLDSQRIPLPVATVAPNETATFSDLAIQQHVPATAGTYILKWDLVYIRTNPPAEVPFDDPQNPGGPTPPGEQIVNVQIPTDQCVHPWQCNQYTAGHALADALAPKITFAICFPGPGGLCGISGTGFGTEKGRLAASLVAYDGQPAGFDLRISSWRDDFIQATIPEDVSRVVDQTWTVRVIAATSHESNDWPFRTFRPAEELTMLSSSPSSNIVVKCDQSSFVDSCLGFKPPPTFEGFHARGPQQLWVTGQDRYEINNLPFSCTIDHLDVVGAVTISGFQPGGSSARINANWSVGLGQDGTVDYDLTIWITGPRGVPCQP